MESAAGVIPVCVHSITVYIYIRKLPHVLKITACLVYNNVQYRAALRFGPEKAATQQIYCGVRAAGGADDEQVRHACMHACMQGAELYGQTRCTRVVAMHYSIACVPL